MVCRSSVPRVTLLELQNTDHSSTFNDNQVIANKAYFAKAYPMDEKSKYRNNLKLFCREFTDRESLTFDGLINKHEKYGIYETNTQ